MYLLVVVEEICLPCVHEHALENAHDALHDGAHALVTWHDAHDQAHVPEHGPCGAALLWEREPFRAHGLESCPDMATASGQGWTRRAQQEHKRARCLALGLPWEPDQALEQMWTAAGPQLGPDLALGP